MWAMWEEKINRAYKHSFLHGMERLDIIRGSAAAGLSRHSEGARSDGVSANLLAARADTVAIRSINSALH
jgi:hypothetical protein